MFAKRFFLRKNYEGGRFREKRKNEVSVKVCHFISNNADLRSNDGDFGGLGNICVTPTGN